MIREKSDEPVVTLEDVVVDYGRFRALHGVTLALPKGATGLVGRNGAGKSTLLRLLLGLVRPTSGGGTVLGRDLKTPGAVLRQQVGFMPENDSLVPGMKGLEQVVLAGELCGLSAPEAARRAHEVLAYAKLGEARYRKVEQYSAGMRQRLKLAIALVHDPELLLLDEPTVGLDPPGRKQMLDLVADLVHRHAKSIILCTHLLGDIEHTCDHVAMIDSGRLLRAGRIADLNSAPASSFRVAWEGPNEPFLRRLQNDGVQLQEEPASAGRGATAAAMQAHFLLPRGFDSRRLFTHARASGVRLWELQPEEEQLADLYHRLLGEPGGETGALDRDG